MWVDDKILTESDGISLPEFYQGQEESISGGGLFVGGLPFLFRDRVDKAGGAGSVNGLIGTISDIVFLDEL